MAEASQDNRTLPATPRKIERAREEGQVARSRDLGHLAALGVAVGLIGVFAPEITGAFSQAMADGLRFDVNHVREAPAMLDRLVAMSGWLLLALLPIGLISVAMALAAGVLAGGWNFTWKALEPKLEKLDPIAGIKRLFSAQQLADTLKACLLALLLGLLGGLYLAGPGSAVGTLLAMPLPQALVAAGELIRSGLLLLTALLLAFALVDVPLQRQLLLRRLRMNIEELKKEMRDVEGNAEVKGKMRLRMREIVNRRMLAAVPRADLVVMNPTHYAVALAYDESKMAAPRVVAKGADLLALKIRDIARDAKVPVLEAPPLARALYAHCDIDHEVPARLFAAVAQVLAWVYGLRDAVAAGKPHLAPPPVPAVPEDMDPLAGRPAGAEGTEGPEGTAA
jgi:flagellar biosynthetic protein FlhB